MSRRRWVLVILGGLFGLVLLAAATLPLWFGAALGALAPRWGLTFNDYARIGYGRFVLTGVEYRGGGLRATAARIEADSPLAWVWERTTGNGGVVRINDWTVAMTAAEGSTAAPPASDAPTGWVPLRTRIRETVSRIEPWLERATLKSGVVRRSDTALSIPSAEWHQRTLSIDQLAFQDRVIDARLVVPAREDAIDLTARTETDEARIAIASRGASVSGGAAWWGEPVEFNAEFPSHGWMPAHAELSADGWDVPAERLKLGELYAAVRGNAHLVWDDESFTVDVTAQSTPRGEGEQPPLDVVLRGRGTLQEVTIERFNVQMPGATARLTTPVTVTRAGDVRDAPARFETQIELDQLPWIDASGTVSGEARVLARATGTTTPPVEFSLEASDVSAEGVTLTSAAVQGRLDWPRIQVSDASVVGAHRERLRASGGWDFKTREALDVSVEGELRRETFARWLPEKVTFASVAVNASADGPLARINHRGKLSVTNVEAGSSKPLDVALEWNGVGKTADRIIAAMVAGESRLSLIGSADTDHVRLTALEFAPRGESPLRLTQPASLRWRPSLQLEGLELRGPRGGIDASLTWGKSGHVALALNQVPSSWFADFVELPGLPWSVSAAAVNGVWDEGPMQFEAVADFTAALRDNRTATVNVHVRGNENGVRILGLRAAEGGTPVLTATGAAPAVITPGASRLIDIEPAGEVALNVRTVENEALWQQLGDLAGVTLKAPRITANISGTWREPKGNVHGRVEQVAFKSKAGERDLPVLEEIELALTGDRGGVVLERLALRVEGQTVRASGRLPFPENDWAEMRKEPLAYARRGAELRIDVPAAEIAAFSELLPDAVIPQGTIEASIALEDGALDGSLQLRRGATRPLGALGALHEITAGVRLEGDVIRLENVSAELGGESVRIDGTMTLPPLDRARGESIAAVMPDFDITVQAQNIPLVRRIGTLVRADLDLALVSPREGSPIVTGKIRLRDGLFLQDVRGLIPSGTKSEGTRPPYFSVEADPFSQWRLDVRVAGEEFMRLRTTLFKGTASADFHLTGTLGEPTLLGEATIDRGNVSLPFATFQVQEGRVALTPAQPHVPQIYLTATTRRFEYDLRMEVTGDASSPTLLFDSTPSLEHGQVLLLVMAGVVPNDDVNLTQQQRATRLGTYLGRSLLSSFGGGEDTNRLTITSGEDITEQGRETYEIEYELNDRWSLTAEFDEYDTHSVGVKWQALARGGTALASSSSELYDTGDSTSEPGEGATGGDDPAAAEEASREPAEIDVSGLGWFSDLEMEASLKRLMGDDYDAALDSHTIEDAVFLLLSAVREDGYLRPELRIHVVNTDGTRREFTVDAELATRVPPDLAASTVEFYVERGTHYFVDELEISGLDAIEEEAARAYFVGDPGLFERQSALTFTPDRLRRGVANLEAALRARGYADAIVQAAEPRIDHNSGEVAIDIDVDENARWQIVGVDVEGAASSLDPAEGLARFVGEPWSESMEQDIAAEVRNKHLESGYADARVRITHRTEPSGEGERFVGVIARVEPGQRVEVGEVRFEGHVKTKDSVLRRRVSLSPGDPLNPLAVQEARHRLSRLGVFDDIDVHLEPQDGAVRDIVFNLEPGRRLELNLLAGYNTYEHLRAGVEVRRFNLWGRAHQTRALLVQSLKSSRGEYSYTVPELFGEDVTGTARLIGLRREEPAFLREEYGARLTLDTPLRFLGAHATVGYAFEVLRNRDNELESRLRDPRQIEVASVEAGLTRDRRDNPLLPRDGYRWFGRVEAASELLGGAARYERIEFGGTYHLPWGAGRWLHFSAAHGVVTTLGTTDDQLPVNKRFFPGGDGSIRGYELGEAAPRAEDGRFVGAKSYLSTSVEFEQALAGKWSAVVFVDALGAARSLADYPFDAVLLAVGLGVRYQTLIGPIRAEYGYNLNRRAGDPSGTFLLSIGFPF